MPYHRTVVDCATGAVSIIEATPEEQAQIDADRAAFSAAEAERIEDARIEALYAACKAWQTRPLNHHTCDDLFASKLIDCQERAILNGESFGPKATASMQWLATLWADYDARKANGSTDYDFSPHGGCPHSFNEVRIERLGGG